MKNNNYTKHMTANQIEFEMYEEYLKKRFNLYISYSKNTIDFSSYFAKEQYGVKTYHIPIDIKKLLLGEYVEILNFLKQYPEIQCILSYNKWEEKYQASLVMQSKIKNNENIEQEEVYTIFDNTLFDVLNILEIKLGDNLEEQPHKQTKKQPLKTLKKQKTNENR